jgi:hypothetical protein
MNKSDQINELAAALSKAQGALLGAVKDSSNPFFKSKYADLSSVWDACRAALAANGLSVTQTTDGADASVVTVITTLMHSSGQWIDGNLTMRPKVADPQGIGSTITYARRYALAAMVGVAPEDDDGNAGSRGHTSDAGEPVTASKIDHAKVAKAKAAAVLLVDADGEGEGGMVASRAAARAILKGLHQDEQIELQRLLKEMPSGKTTYYPLFLKHYNYERPTADFY